MPKKIELTLPVPPSVNRIWRRSKHGGMYKVKAAADFDVSVYAAWLRAYPKYATKIPFPEGPVRYTMTWYRYPLKGDTSNRIKVLEDSLNGIAWTDDAQVTDLRVIRKDVKKGQQRIELTIEEASE